MLLVDGNPYSLNNDEVNEYGNKIIWHVPPRPKDLVNTNIPLAHLPAGVGIPNTYIKVQGGRNIRVTYYTREEWNEERKRKEYYVDNTGPMIIFGNKGKIVSQNAEFNWFMAFNPHNNDNSLRERVDTNPYKDKAVLFHRYNPAKSGKLSQDLMRAKRELIDLFDEDSPRRWGAGDVVLACKTLCLSAEKSLPNAIIDYLEYKDEANIPVLRNALLSFADQEPLYMRSVLVTGRRNIINRTIQKCIEHEESTSFKYNPTLRNYTYTDNKGKEQIFLEVPEKKDPDKFILDTLFADYKKLEQLNKLLDRVTDPVVA